MLNSSLSKLYKLRIQLTKAIETLQRIHKHLFNETCFLDFAPNSRQLHLDLANFSLEYVAASKCYRIVLRKILLDDPNAASLLFAVLDTLTPLSLFSSHQNLCIHLIQCLSEARKHGTYATLSSLAPDFAAYLAPYLPVFLLV